MLNFKEKRDNTVGIIEKPGFYEMELTAEWAETNEKVPYINCIFTVRDDVNQEFQGKRVWDGIYKNKNTGEYNYNKIQAILETQENPKYDFEDYDAIIQHFNGLLLKAEVTIKEADERIPNSKRKNEIKYLCYGKSKFPKKLNVTATSRFEEKNNDVDVTDTEDLPF